MRFGAREIVNVSLGATPIKIGSDNRACTIYARGARPLAVAYRLEGAAVECIDYATEKTASVKPGDERVVGNVTVTVRAAATAPATKLQSKAALVPPAPPAPLRGKDSAAAPAANTAAASGATSQPSRPAKPPPPPPPPSKQRP